MKKIKVDLQERSYFINIGKGILSSSGKIIRSVSASKACFIVSNSRIRAIYGKVLDKSLKSAGFDTMFFDVADSEASKSHSVWFRVMKSLAGFDKSKGSCLVALGGGVIGDLGGFAAATFRRGIDFFQIPTTLLAQVDAAIGGKVAIDMDFAKNLVGAFYQPKSVITDIGVLKTLPIRQIRNGLSEIIKYAVIFDEKLFSYIEKNIKGILSFDINCLEHVVAQCSKLKAGVVSADEKEKKGYRSILNFGHTIGHAIESASSYSSSIHHGEAVALGMLVAFDIAVSIGMADECSAQRLENLLKSAGLPVMIKGVKLSSILSATLYDKKTINGISRWILPESIGHAVVCSHVPKDIIKKSVLSRC
jgi:3-dehydroquinate synthase